MRDLGSGRRGGFRRRGPRTASPKDARPLAAMALGDAKPPPSQQAAITGCGADIFAAEEAGMSRARPASAAALSSLRISDGERLRFA